MKSNIKELFPQWCDNIEDYFSTMLTDDVDGLVSCALLNKIKGYNINYYYDFKNIYEIEESDDNSIAVDADIVGGKCWGNHVTMLSKDDTVNKSSANLNNIFKISRTNYTSKFCGSTAIQVWSYYDLPLPETEEGKMLLLCLDVGFKGHYSTNFKSTHNKWLEHLDFKELVEVLNRHTSQEFYALINKYKLASKIKLNKGILSTNINLSALEGFFNLDLSLPDGIFTKRNEFHRHYLVELISKTYTKKDLPKIFSIALTFKNKVCYTEII